MQESFSRTINKKSGFVNLSSFSTSDWFWFVIIMFALFSILMSFVEFSPRSISTDMTEVWRKIVNWYKPIEPYIRMSSWAISAAFVYGIAYSVTQRNKLFKLEEERVNPKINEVSDIYANHKWERVLKHIESHNESDWKLAILEADIMLDELLEKSGYRGETMGDKLKQVDKSDFNTIDMAWDAHKIRNMIAHEGADYKLNAREAQRVMKLYEQVFKEFKYI